MTFLLLILLGIKSNFASTDIVFEEDHQLPLVYLNIVADAGVAQDPNDKLGLANITTQMLLRGTRTHPKLEFFKLIEGLGGTLSIETRTEGTVIHAAVLSENLEKFLALVQEALLEPKFDSKELKSLKKEVEGTILEEKGNDQWLVSYHSKRFYYGSHPYGHPLLGTLNGISAITLPDVLFFYENHFGGNTLKLFGSGATHSSQIQKWFSQLCEKLSQMHPQAAAVSSLEKPHFATERRALLVNKPKATQSQVYIMGEGMRPEMPGFYAILLANHSFGGHSFTSRLMREVRVKRGWSYGAYDTFIFGSVPSHYFIWIFPKTADTSPAIQLSLDLLENFAKHGVTKEEFEFARTSLINHAPFDYDTPKKRLENITTEYLTHFPKDYKKNFAKNIAAVNYDEIIPAVERFFQPSKIVLTVVGDASKLKPLISKIKGFEHPQIKNYLED